MPKFDESKAYAEQEEDVFFDDGREIELLHHIFAKPDIDEIRGDPVKVLRAIDDYGRTKKYLMNVGEDKGKIVSDLIAEVKPETMVELGGYVGYSCILFGHALRQAGGKHYYSLERNPEFAAVILALVDLAGLRDVVRVIIGPSDASLKRLHESGTLRHINLLFLDHYKPAYTSDLKLCEALGLIGPGAVLAADNVIKPGNPQYLEYVRASPKQKKERLAATRQSGRERSGDEQIPEKYLAQYEKRVSNEAVDWSVEGNPKLVYESRLVESYEPTGVPDGVEITRCVGIED